MQTLESLKILVWLTLDKSALANVDIAVGDIMPSVATHVSLNFVTFMI